MELSPKRILVIDDADSSTALAALLREHGYQTETACHAAAALRKYDAFEPDVVMTGLDLPRTDGIALVRKLHALATPATMMVMTAHGTVASAVDAIHAGASEYLSVPLDVENLLALLAKVRRAGSPRNGHAPPPSILGTSARVARLLETIDQVASSRATVLITGESGTGKELVAHALHARSQRAGAPFVRVHCAALAETLLESELFGHERGAFTGADARKDGLFHLANGGTLFLDEIGEISPSVQVKLLRFLQDHELERVGGTETIRVDVRVVAATHRNLRERVARGLFREDLYYRLDVVALEVPSLRERSEDIPLLAEHFVDELARENDKRITGISPEAMDILVAYPWPGNIRELQNAMERAVVLSSGPLVEPRVLPPCMLPPPTSNVPSIPGATWAEITRYAILETVAAMGGSRRRAAEILGICARTIDYRLHEYNGELSTSLLRQSEGSAPGAEPQRK